MMIGIVHKCTLRDVPRRVACACARRVLVGVSVISLSMLTACTQHSEPQRAVIAATGTAVADHAFVVAIDPCSGEIVAPSAAQRQALVQQQANGERSADSDAPTLATTRSQGLVGAAMQLPPNRRSNAGSRNPMASSSARGRDHAATLETANMPATSEDCVDKRNPIQ